jgi:YidC/Oxa1 family membrane protein insertase
VSFWSAWRELRRFQKFDPAQRNLVFYSESRQDWHHFAPILQRLTQEHGRSVCYVSSDPGDFAFAEKNPRLLCFHIPEGVLRMLFFQTLRADVLVLTMLDLGNFELKRSVHPVHYVYLFHSIGSTHMVDHANSYDHYDSILCSGPHHDREIRRREELAGLPAKRLLPHGSHRVETLMAERARRGPPVREPGSEGTVLVAPTWGERSLLAECGERLIEVLLGAGLRVILRPHYQTVKRAPALVQRLRARFGVEPRFEYIDWMGESESLYRSELLICDWSHTAIEYALGLEKPVLFIDVPPRVRNPSYRELGIEPVEVSIRSQVGAVLAPEHVERAPGVVARLLADAASLPVRAAILRKELLYNLGSSAESAARQIAELADERAAERDRG